MHRWLVTLAAAIIAALALPGAAFACSVDDKAYFDGFPDASCLLPGATNTEIDTLGGLRLKTNGVPVPATWDTQPEFEDGIAYAGDTFAPVDRSTLEVVGPADAGATLELPKTTMPLTPSSQPVLPPAASPWLDSDAVRDPSVVKAAQYVMYYTGVAEDGSGPAIFRLTSANGSTWTRPADAALHQPVLTATDGAFDEHGVYGADVVYEPGDAEAPYKMWYSGAGGTFDQIGYATSLDGIAWTKHDGDDADALPDPVVPVGLPGSQDAFSVAHPAVLFDGGLWKMWYEGDDSTKKSIGYATSTDGLTWAKAGAVIESGAGNVEFGVFAPTVWKDGDSFEMLVGGRKETSGELQTKLIAADSPDGLDWTLGNIALNPGNFAASNLSSPEVVPEGKAIKLYYSGNDANGGDARDRIGFATGTGGTATAPVLDIAPRSALLDAREAFGLAAARPGGVPDELAGVYVGLKEDRVPRMLPARSDATGETWTKTGTAAVLPQGTTNQFDEDGQRDPHLVYDQDSGANFATDYFLYFTGVDDGVETIGLSTTEDTPTTRQPDHSKWVNPGATAFFGRGGAGQFDEAGVSHPSVVHVAVNDWTMYYTARSAGGATTIGKATTTSPGGIFGSRQAITLNAAAAGSPAAACDEDGRRDPEAVMLGGVVHLLFVGLQTVEGETIERTCWARATSVGGTATFDRMGPVLNPSQLPYAFDETGAAPSSVVADADGLRVFTTGTDRSGRRHAGTAATALPLAASATVGIPNGWATYQMGDADTPVRDFQDIAATATGTGTEIWMSVLQPYSTAATLYWSDPFPVDAVSDGGQELNFQLGDSANEGVRAVRWQARLRRPEAPADPPSLDRVTIGHADVSFFASGSATTEDIQPPEEFTLQSWTSLTLTTRLFQPLGTGAASGTVTVVDDTGATVVPATAVTVPGETTVSLAGVDAAAKPKLRARLDLTSATGQASPLIEALKVEYSALAPGATPTPSPTPTPPAPPAPVLTFATSTPKIVYGKAATLAGTATQSGAGLVGQVVTVFAQPRGATAPVQVGTATTTTGGAWTLAVKPRKRTVYTASLAAAAAPAPVTVLVKHRVTLKVALKGRRATFKGALGPKHRRRAVTLQRKSGTGWRKVATVKTSRRATYTFTKRLAKGRFTFRAITPKDADHLAGRSPRRKVRVR